MIKKKKSFFVIAALYLTGFLQFLCSKGGSGYSKNNGGGGYNGGGGTFSCAASVAGPFPYHCTIHGAAISGTLVVTL